MTDITTTTTPITTRHPGLLRLRLPKFRIGAAFVAMCLAVGQAVDLAYVWPYRTARRQPPVDFDANLQGRDPNW